MDNTYITPPTKKINLRTVTDTSPFVYEFDYDYDTEPIRKVNRKLSFSQETVETAPPSNSD